MSDEGQEPTEATEETEETQESPAIGQEPTPASSMAELPDWAQNEIKALRAEAAKNRKAAKDAEKKAEADAATKAAEQGKFKELYEAEQKKRLEAEQAAEAAKLARLKEKIGRELKVPASLIDRLQGETEDELKADAEAIIADLPKPTPSGDTNAEAGRNQSAPTPNMTEAEVLEFAAKYNLSPEIAKRQLLKTQ